jgi:prevent-host-death family protein
MREVGVTEAETSLRALLDQVVGGEEVVITRGGKPVARMVPTRPTLDRTAARRAASNLLEASKGMTLNGLTIKDLVTGGRR